MEHRRFKRNPLSLAVQLITGDDRAYHARALDISPIGMRVVANKRLPKNIKVMDVLLSGPVNAMIPGYRMPMFVVHKDGRDMGLCLLNEGDRIDINSQWLGDADYSGVSKNAELMMDAGA